MSKHKNEDKILYKTRSDNIDNKKLNFGLWYNKFFDQWIIEEGTYKINEKWGNFDDNDGPIPRGGMGDEKIINEYKNRQKELIETMNGKEIRLSSLSKLLIGFGNQHPVENGLMFHHTLGVPYVPGSSLKGAVRAYSRKFVDIESEEIKRIFGHPDEGIGSVIFLDIIPIQRLQVIKDFMTPHYGPYYESPKNPPVDGYDPNIIPFLAVKEQKKFQTGIIPRNEQDDQDEEDLQMVKEWVIDTVKKMGLGAKTSVGYGRFKEI